ncbi:MAG TPA: hypothetical protein PK948_08135 [Gemmatimonadales bacterium]|nr:hypothetical protein [Gemmatimonadales bacterium]
MPNDRPITASEVLLALGELAHEVRQTGATLASMRSELADVIVWARRDRLQAETTIADRDRTIAELRASHSEEAMTALRAQVDELQKQLDAPPTTLTKLANRGGLFVDAIIAGMTGPRLAGMVGILAALVIACGMGWQVWHFPTETAASIVMRILDIIAGMTGSAPSATPSGMVPS